MKYQVTGIIPQDRREDINAKILTIIQSNDLQSLSMDDIYSGYTGVGGLHGLKRKDYENYYAFSEDKKKIENGQFFTPGFFCGQISGLLNVEDHETVCDLTCGAGAFFNWFKEPNCYGCEIDEKASRVARFLYPEAHIETRDIRYYHPDQKFDYVVGNPPFNLRWDIDDEAYASQLYYCMKAAEVLKPGGIMAIIVPYSFMNDLFSDKWAIEPLNKLFNFCFQYQLSDEAFATLGVSSFPTKVMCFQLKAEALPEVMYTPTFTEYEECKELMKGIQATRHKMRVKLQAEMLMHSGFEFRYTVKKYLYEIKTHKPLKPFLGKAESFVDKFRTQRKPANMDDKEWEKSKLTENKVLAYLKRIMKKQNEPKQVDEIRFVKTNYGFKLKAYSKKSSRQMHAQNSATKWNINDLIVNNRPVDESVPKWAKKLLRQKHRLYKLQTTPWKQMERKADIDEMLRKFAFINFKGEKCKFNDFQKNDIGLILQKPYAILNWQQGCVDADTEFLTPTGWKPISEYTKGDMVAQFNLGGNHIEFVKPTAYIKQHCNWMYHFHHKYGLDQVLSPEHRMLYLNKSGLKWGEKTAQEVYTTVRKNKNGIHGVRLPTQFKFDGGTGIDISNHELRLQVAVMADGSFKNSENPHCTVRLKKQRKIERMRMLLEKCNLKNYDRSQGDYQVFSFKAPLTVKTYNSFFYAATIEQMKIITEECILWDGSVDDKGNKFFFSTIKESADFIQYCFSCQGYTASIYTDERENKPICYTVRVRRVDSGFLSIKGDSVSKFETKDGFKYCFQVPSTYLILRRNNKIFITGNSGKTPAAAAWMRHNSSLRNTFIIGPAVAINMTWTKFMELHKKNYVNIRSMQDVYDLKVGQYALISLDFLVRYERQVSKYVKMQSHKVAVLFDESDEITNARAKRTKAVLSCFRKAKRKLLATGTTTRNNITELYSQLKFLYNNSIQMLCYCEDIWVSEYSKTDKEWILVREVNEHYMQPFPPKAGSLLFKRCFNPEKSTVFGIKKHNQDLHHQQELRNIIEYTIITRKFKDIAGDKYYITHKQVTQTDDELELYRIVMEEFYSIVGHYFSSTGNSKKDAGLRLVRQMQLLIKATSVPQVFKEYTGDRINNKAYGILNELEKHDCKVAIGCTTLEAVDYYIELIGEKFPSRPVTKIIGEVGFSKRDKLRAEFESTHNGILICTQQSLRSSVNIPSCDYVIMESMQWNIPKMEQFFFRFIRYDSQNKTEVCFINYHNTIEANLLALLMNKERLNDFIKTLEYVEDSDIYEEYGIDLDILNNIITKEYDDKGKVKVSWGKAKEVTEADVVDKIPETVS